MDPVACLIDAERWLKESDMRTSCAECLANYFAWRIKGGFEPTGGDAKATNILMRLGGVADTLSEALS